MRTLYGSALWEARTAGNWKRKLSQYLIYPLEHLSRRLADVSTAIGTEATNLYKSDGISKLFVPKHIFFPGPKTLFPSCIFIGTWGGRKRGEFVVEQFLQHILTRFPEAKLYMACDKVPKHDSIVDLQHPSAETLGEIVRQSWVLLSASTYEGFGIPFLEALTSGTCVVTTRNSGAEYVLVNGEYGAIVEDVEFGDMVAKVIQDTAVRKHFEEAGLQRAAEFSEQIVVDEHLMYYTLAIERFRGNLNGNPDGTQDKR
jgi:glycosyltransferase involved in cell wall biosynthesis